MNFCLANRRPYFYNKSRPVLAALYLSLVEILTLKQIKKWFTRNIYISVVLCSPLFSIWCGPEYQNTYLSSAQISFTFPVSKFCIEAVLVVFCVFLPVSEMKLSLSATSCTLLVTRTGTSETKKEGNKMSCEIYSFCLSKV